MSAEVLKFMDINDFRSSPGWVLQCTEIPEQGSLSVNGSNDLTSTEYVNGRTKIIDEHITKPKAQIEMSFKAIITIGIS